ncbi:MAG: hypothetical protein AAGD22_16425 [Verrucomicrobiota bacterium]
MNPRFLIAFALSAAVATLLIKLCFTPVNRAVSNPDPAPAPNVYQDATVLHVGKSPVGSPASIPPEARTIQDWNQLGLKGLLNLEKKDYPSIDRAQLQAYLLHTNESVDALLVANALFDTDPSFLGTALERYPRDPRVLFATALSDQFQDQRKTALESLLEHDPENAYALYLASSHSFDQNDYDSAISLLKEGVQKNHLESYRIHNWQAAQEFFQHLGFSSDVANGLAAVPVFRAPHPAQLLVPYLKELESHYDSLIKSDQTVEALELAALAIETGNSLSQGQDEDLQAEYIGLALEASFLEKLDPNLDYQYFPDGVPILRSSVQNQEVQLNELLMAMMESVPKATNLQLAHYLDRVKLFGDRAANQWLVAQIQGP